MKECILPGRNGGHCGKLVGGVSNSDHLAQHHTNPKDANLIRQTIKWCSRKIHC